ncbi:phage tail sheath subtilisin-like domain-containing protein [Streptomyces flaveus]|uniref:phage tail sheath subtilisin-like domain-containing protein n=1 Tax=Streptomyces flaveus TaxID=66370 RepID=UPI003328C06C
MTQAGYPGVYIEEFTPGSPIAGISTSTVAFLGTAKSGPSNRPTRINSWDAFQSQFGDFLAERPAGYLAPAVYGFFLNGGQDCFILRASTAKYSSRELQGQGASPAPVLDVVAVEEGVGGDAIEVEIRHSSLLADVLGPGAANPTLAVHHAPAAQLNADLPVGAGTDRRTIMVDNRKFLVGETVLLEAGAKSQPGVVQAKTGNDRVVLVDPVPGVDTYNGGKLRSADLQSGQREVLVQLPDGVRLDLALPRGSTVTISKGPGNPDFRTVESTTTHSGWGSITLDRGLSRKFVTTGAPPRVASLEFDLVVRKGGLPTTYGQLSMNPEHPNYWGSAVTSDLITLREHIPPPAAPTDDPRPAILAPTTLIGGEDDVRTVAWSDLESNPNGKLALLDPYGEIDIVCIPGATSADAQQALVAYCERRKDRVAILDSARGASPTDEITAQAAGLGGAQRGFGALYYPWIRARNPLSRRLELWPPSGHVAGVYARTDATEGVHTAPANANLRGALDLERLLSNEQQDPLNRAGINVLRIFPGRAEPVVWGARTTATQERNWQYINIRRLFIYLEKSIEESIQWAVFQPNNLSLWQELRRTIGDFLTKAWRDGALFGATARDAFYVRIDEVLNPENERALGRLVIEIGLKPTYPAEFIVIRIGIWQGGSEISESQ